MKLRYLHERNGTYQYRRAIPESLRHAFGKREIKRSLKTDQYDLAAIEYAGMHRIVERQFQAARHGASV